MISSAQQFAANANQLASILGVSRQLIAYHVKQDQSPGRRSDGTFDVEAWRDYIKTFGKGAKVKDSKPCFGSNLLRDVAETCARFHLESAASVLPDVIGEFSGLPPAHAARLAVLIWTALVCRFSAVMAEGCFDTVLADHNGGTGFDKMWRSFGWGDTSSPPASIPLTTPSEIMEAAQLAGINLGGIINMKTE